MTDSSDTSPSGLDLGLRVAYILAFLLIVIGMANTLPEIAGLQGWLREVTGRPLLRISGYPTEYFYPLVFVVMMTIVVLENSFYRDWKTRHPHIAWLGLAIDIGLILAAVLGSIGYLSEIDSVCLFDQISGERARLIAEIQASQVPGLSLDAEVPNCQARFGPWIVPLLFYIIVLFFVYNVRVWGGPLVIVASIVVFYTIATALIWVFDLSDNNFLLTKLGSEGGDAVAAATQKAANVFITPDGFMGRFMDIVVSQVFPYVVLGALFGASAAGTSLIKFAVLVTRRLRGGPAHAAIVSSALFGTITGGPVVNVLSTGRLTIPMMIRNGFNPYFAGGVEASASSGGQIMPPVMGVAAFVLVALTGVPYDKVVVSAFLPALAFFASIFIAVVFQARKQGIEPVGDVPEDLRMVRQDWWNLVVIFGPIGVILWLLLGNKDAVGLGPLGWIMGVETEMRSGVLRPVELNAFLQTVANATGDAISAGWWAVAILIPLLFIDTATRRRPSMILRALADGGMLLSRLFLLLFAVSIIAAFLNESGLTGELTRAITTWLDGARYINLFGWHIEIAGGIYLMLALTCAMVAAILLGMGMPTVPAYVNVALLLGPLLSKLGVSFFTANMFVFYFAVASAITPPVAVAAFAAATITRGEPMRTGLAAVRVGIVMFTIPFIFAWYPELLLIEDAVTITTDLGGKELIAGYSGSVDVAALCLLGLRLAMSLYLMASALTQFDRRHLSRTEMVLRLVLAVLVLWKTPSPMFVGLAGTVLLLSWHHLGARILARAPA